MEENQYKIPKWLWLGQILLFRGLGTGIAIYEITAEAAKFRWEAMLFAGWLFLIPEAVKGKDAALFKALSGRTNGNGKSE